MKFLIIYIKIICILKACQCGHIKVTDQVYFDIAVGFENVGRIIIGLFGETAPKTVKNFKQIATEGVFGKTYVGSGFHRVVQRFMIQGGDIVNHDGTGSLSVYGDEFEDERFEVNHTAAGFVSMANSGPNTNGCQFFITTIATPWLDGRHVVFGKVIKGQGIVHKIEHLKTDYQDRPVKPVVIVESGEIPTPSPFYVSDSPNELTIWAWIEAGWFPLSFSIAIMAFFHYIMRCWITIRLLVNKL